MKKFLILLVMSLLLVMANTASAQKGGVVTLKGNDLVYWDLDTRKTVVLNSRLKIQITSPFAISADGKVVVWRTDDGNFHKWNPPLGSERILGRAEFDLPAQYKTREFQESISLRYQDGHKAMNFALSPMGDMCSFETVDTNPHSIIFVPPNTPQGYQLHQLWRQKSLGLGTVLNYYCDPQRFPLYIDAGPESVRKSHIFQVGPGQSSRCNAGIGDIGNGHQIAGSLNFKALSGDFFKRSPQSLNEHIHEGGIYATRQHGTAGWSDQDFCNRASHKRDAYYGTWLNNNLFAVIYYTEEGSNHLWGPIEIRDLSLHRDINPNSRKPDVYEINFHSAVAVVSLSWRRNSDPSQFPSLTILMEDGKVYEFEGTQIQAGMNKSGLVKNRGLGEEYLYANNVFNISPKLVAQGIHGTNLCWITESDFQFRGNDGALYVCQNGRIEKLANKILENYAYCRLDFEAIKSSLNAKPANIPDPKNQEFTYGTDKVASTYADRNNQFFTVGTMKIEWRWFINTETKSIVALRACDRIIGQHINWDKVQFCIPGIDDMDQIIDPSAYKYEPAGTHKHPTVNVKTGQIVLFKLNGSYVALKFTGNDVERIDCQWKAWKKGFKTPRPKRDLAKTSL